MSSDPTKKWAKLVDSFNSLFVFWLVSSCRLWRDSCLNFQSEIIFVRKKISLLTRANSSRKTLPLERFYFIVYFRDYFGIRIAGYCLIKTE